MDFINIIKALENTLQSPLPGAEAHEPMRTIPIGDLKQNFDHKIMPKQGSVMILLYKEKAQIKFPLIKRQEYVGTHSGQISFPGGKAEIDEDVFQTALRETEEEIGINKSVINVIGRLSDFFVMPSNFMVTPIVAFLDNAPVFIPNSFEVAKVISCNVYDLLNDDAIRKKEIIAGGQFRLMAPHFEVEGEIVWGATAMMLNEFRVVLKRIMN